LAIIQELIYKVLVDSRKLSEGKAKVEKDAKDIKDSIDSIGEASTETGKKTEEGLDKTSEALDKTATTTKKSSQKIQQELDKVSRSALKSITPATKAVDSLTKAAAGLSKKGSVGIDDFGKSLSLMLTRFGIVGGMLGGVLGAGIFAAKTSTSSYYQGVEGNADLISAVQLSARTGLNVRSLQAHQDVAKDIYNVEKSEINSLLIKASDTTRNLKSPYRSFTEGEIMLARFATDTGQDLSKVNSAQGILNLLRNGFRKKPGLAGRYADLLGLSPQMLAFLSSDEYGR